MQDIAVMDTTCVIDVIHLLKDVVMLYHMETHHCVFYCADFEVAGIQITSDYK